jgi:hypothetical protein
MNSLYNFLKQSKQFHSVSQRMFNNVFKIDHYAYRTFDMYGMIDKYKHSDYILEKDEYTFGNNVSARWLSKEGEPHVFISQYNGISQEEHSKYRSSSRSRSSSISSSSLNFDKLDYYIKRNITPDLEFYKQVNEYNQYVGSTLLFSNQINHIAFLVNDIEETCHKIKTDFPEYTLNNPENPIQVSTDKELMQFSINAELVDYKFTDGIEKVPFSFIEFIERKNGRKGFEGKNAEKIFTSTNH